MNEINTPQHLYKILPYDLWMASQNNKMLFLSAADDAFIHFSKEDQLEKTINKFFANEDRFVVLKIETEKLEGNLVYETNPGRPTKYYHLYNGHIPFRAISEAKIVYQKHDAASLCAGLDIVQIGEPVLRQKARTLSHEEIKSDDIQTLIEQMKITMRAAPGVGLAAPQIGKPIQLAVIEDIYSKDLPEEQREKKERRDVPFHVIINPTLTVLETETKEFFEGCLSIPYYVGIVPRAKAVRVECLNERAEPVVIEAKGWYARILQHEIDHLNATLYIDRALSSTIMPMENYVKHWKGIDEQDIIANLCPKCPVN